MAKSWLSNDRRPHKTRGLVVACALLATSACNGEPQAPLHDDPAPDSPPTVALLRIKTPQPGIERRVYQQGAYRLLDTAGGISEGQLEIRGRGTSSWGLAKTSFRLELERSTTLLSMPESRHWVLLANHFDVSLLRNDLAFATSRSLGMEFTPRSRFVDLELNGEYHGLYQLTEQVRIGKHRIHVPRARVGAIDDGDLTGSYLIEVDERRGESFCVESKRTKMIFCLRSPENLLEARWAQHRDYIERYLHATDDAIFGERFAHSEHGYAAFLDVDATIDWYLVNELLKNLDGDLRVSTFLYKKRRGKLTFGPVWDFDRAIGNVKTADVNLPEGWYIRRAPWFARLFEDHGFERRVAARWRGWRGCGIPHLQDHLAARRRELRGAWQRNAERWATAAATETLGTSSCRSFDQEIDALGSWLAARAAWLDQQFAGSPSER